MRPTTDDLARAAGHLEELAWRYHSRNNPNSFPDAAKLLDLLVWLDTELPLAKAAAAYGPGTDVHTIGRHGLGRPVEGRFAYPEAMTQEQRGIVMADPYVRSLLSLRSGWRTELGQLVDGWAERCREAGNWPQRSEQIG